MKTPLDILRGLFEAICFFDKWRRPDSKPGAMISSLPTEKREILSNLKSSDFDDLVDAPYAYYGLGSQKTHEEAILRTEKLNFDKYIKK